MSETRTISTKRAAELLGMTVRNFLIRKNKAKVKGREVNNNGAIKKFYSPAELNKIRTWKETEK